MKTTLLLCMGVTAIFLAGCETEMPPEPGKPAISFKTGEPRDEAFDRPGTVATHRETSTP
jgi:hypothetical protein